MGGKTKILVTKKKQTGGWAPRRREVTPQAHAAVWGWQGSFWALLDHLRYPMELKVTAPSFRCAHT